MAPGPTNPAAGVVSENAAGGVRSTVKVVDVDGSTPFRLSVARVCTVYAPSAGKLHDGRVYDQLEVPVADDEHR